MEEINQAKDQGEYIYKKKLWGAMGQKTKSRTIKDDKLGSKKIHRTVQRRYSGGSYQNQATHVGPEKES